MNKEQKAETYAEEQIRLQDAYIADNYSKPIRMKTLMFCGYDIRDAYLKGAELDAEDIKRIVNIADKIVEECNFDVLSKLGEKKYYEEVLKRYNNEQ